jgi:predicted oxidoreductase
MPDVYGWYRRLGVSFDGLLHFEGDSVARWHRPAGGGARVMEQAWKQFAERGLQSNWRFGLAVIDLLRDGERIAGVLVQNASGQTSELRARAVVLATGGFAGNLAMSRSASTRLRGVGRLLAGGNPDAQGSLHTIVARHQGQLMAMDNVYAYANGLPDYRDPTGHRGVVVRRIKSCIWVNRSGHRFHDEDLHVTGRSATERLLRQDGQTCWIILQETGIPEIEIFDHYVEPNAEEPAQTVARFVSHSPFVSKAGSLRELARLTGIDAIALQKTVADWNNLLVSGAVRDPLTGRTLTGCAPFGNAAWYAIQLFPLVRKTLGGVVTDLKCRVLDNSGSPIGGLFAAGELAGMGGGSLAGGNPLEGLMAGGSVFSGRIAGRWAARTTAAARDRALESAAPPASVLT